MKRIINHSVLLLSLFLMEAGAQTANYVSEKGNVGAWPNSSSSKFHLVKSAHDQLPTSGAGNSLQVEAGIYRESLTMDRPMTLTKSGGTGDVVIGSTSDVIDETGFRLITWNTRLFPKNNLDVLIAADPLGVLLGSIGIIGSQFTDLPFFDDTKRAEYIGRYLAERRTAGVDFVALCEVWNARLPDPNAPPFPELPGGVVPFPTANWDQVSAFSSYPGKHYRDQYGPGPWGGVFLNSGLGALTDLQVTSTGGGDFGAFAGAEGVDADGLSNKGYMWMTVIKNGFTITIFNTHLQAEVDGNDDIAVRLNQVKAVRDQVNAYRQNNPDHIAIILGDINIIGESNGPTSEYLSALEGELSKFTQSSGAVTDRAWDLSRHQSFGSNPPTLLTTYRPSENDFAANFLNGAPVVDERLDYIFYLPSYDGSVIIDPKPGTFVTRHPNAPAGVTFSNLIDYPGYITSELSDHCLIEVEFQLRKLN